MKNLLIILKLMGLMVIFAQAPEVTKPTTDTSKTTPPATIEKQIEQVSNENAKQLIEIKALKLENQEELLNVKRIDAKKESLKSQIMKKVDYLLTRPTRKVAKSEITPSKAEVVKNPSRVDIHELKLDSTCVSYKRDGVLEKKKCVEWEYFKVFEGDKLKIK